MEDEEQEIVEENFYFFIVRVHNDMGGGSVLLKKLGEPYIDSYHALEDDGYGMKAKLMSEEFAKNLGYEDASTLKDLGHIVSTMGIRARYNNASLHLVKTSFKLPVETLEEYVVNLWKNDRKELIAFLERTLYKPGLDFSR